MEGWLGRIIEKSIFIHTEDGLISREVYEKSVIKMPSVCSVHKGGYT
jgi:hypothetical protein